MKKIYIIILLLVNVVFAKSQETMPDITLNEICEKVNNFNIPDVKDDACKIVKDFDFKTFRATEKGNKRLEQYYKIYCDKNNEIYRIARHNSICEEFNFEFLIKDYRDIKLIYAYKFFGCNKESNATEHECGEMISGFFLYDKMNEELYFLGTKYSKESEPNLSITDIYCIMQLDNKMYPTGKLKFFDGYLTYKSEFTYEEELREKVYSYFYQEEFDNEECKKYNNLGRLTLSRIKHIFWETYHCPVALEATVIPEIPNIKGEYVPAWSLNGYSYK